MLRPLRHYYTMRLRVWCVLLLARVFARGVARARAVVRCVFAGGGSDVSGGSSAAPPAASGAAAYGAAGVLFHADNRQTKSGLK